METKNFFVLDTSVLFNALYSKILLDLNFTDLISGDVIIPKPALDEIRRNANPLRLKNGDKREKYLAQRAIEILPKIEKKLRTKEWRCAMCTKSPKGYFWRRLRKNAQEFSLSEADLQIASVAICFQNNGYRNNEDRIVKLLTLDKELANFAKKNGIESPNLFFKKK